MCISLAFLKFNMEFKGRGKSNFQEMGYLDIGLLSCLHSVLENSWSGLLYHVVL